MKTLFDQIFTKFRPRNRYTSVVRIGSSGTLPLPGFHLRPHTHARAHSRETPKTLQETPKMRKVISLYYALNVIIFPYAFPVHSLVPSTSICSRIGIIFLYECAAIFLLLLINLNQLSASPSCTH